MKILMLCDYYSENLQFQENLQTKYYSKHGHSVVVVTSTFDSVFDYYTHNHDNDWPARTYMDGSAKIIKLKYRLNLLNRLRAYTSIAGILEDESPDLIYVHNVMFNMLEAVRYLKRNPNCRMIMDFHGDYSHWGTNWLSLRIVNGVIRKAVLDRARPYLSRIFPVVPAGIQFLHEIYKIPLEEMEVLPLGADLDLLDEVRRSRELDRIRKKYDVESDTKVIVSGGKLSPRKKTEILIQAYREMGRDKKLALIIIGAPASRDHAYYDLLREAAAGRNDIHFAGWLDPKSVYSHLAISHVAVFPASQSILWQHAIAAGLPLIVGNTGHQSIEYLNKYENIMILEGAAISAENLKERLTRVLNDETLRHRMSAGAARVGKECLDWNRLIESTLRFNKIQNLPEEVVTKES